MFLLQNGEILPVKLITWSSVGMTLGFLFLTIVFLTCLRAASSNKTSIVSNGAAALFIAHLVFILGINQADNPVTLTSLQLLISENAHFPSKLHKKRHAKIHTRLVSSLLFAVVQFNNNNNLIIVHLWYTLLVACDCWSYTVIKIEKIGY